MTIKNLFLLGLVWLCSASLSFAQIYAQGKNINRGNTYSITVEMEPKPMDPGKFHAFISFYGQRKDVKWYLKEGVEHKAFKGEEDMKAYLEDHGWIFLRHEDRRPSQSQKDRRIYFFRKSMEQLSSEYDQEASTESLVKNDFK